MTARIVVSCDGHWPGMRCRGAYPTRETDLGDGVWEAEQHGWRRVAAPGGWRDYCPAHTRARAAEAVALDPRWAGYPLADQSAVLELLREERT